MATEIIKPSKEQFEAYVKVQRSGVTNMLDANRVCALAGSGLTKGHCLYIYGHYNELRQEYSNSEPDFER